MLVVDFPAEEITLRLEPDRLGGMVEKQSGGSSELAFLRVLQAISEAEAQAGVDTLDRADRAMLYHIALNETDGGPVKVTDLWKNGAFGTLPTVLSRVARLVDQGWLDKSVNPTDARSRVVSSSIQAQSFFRKASRAVAAAVGGRQARQTS